MSQPSLRLIPRAERYCHRKGCGSESAFAVKRLGWVQRDEGKQMAERLKRAAAWLGLVTDDRYGEEDERNGAPHGAYEPTEGLSREELAAQSPAASSGKVTTLESKRTTNGSTAVSNGHSGAAVTHPPTSSPRTADMSRIITVHPPYVQRGRTIGSTFATAFRSS